MQVVRRAVRVGLDGGAVDRVVPGGSGARLELRADGRFGMPGITRGALPVYASNSPRQENSSSASGR